MRALRCPLKVVVALTLALGAIVGCESPDGASAQASGNVYYGSDFGDPWYYGEYYGNGEVIVVPPDRIEAPPRPSHPIALPPQAGPRPVPQPSIPSVPRASFRR